MSGLYIDRMSTEALTTRQLAIAELLREERYLPISDLAERFTVTTQTIRRDAAILCDNGLARRLHKGIKSIDFPGTENLAYSQRSMMNALGKREIAELVAELVPADKDVSVSLGIGTTPEQIAAALGRRERLMIATNNLNVAFALSGKRDIRVLVSGGNMRPNDRDFVGIEPIEFFSRYRVDFGITGVGGIDENGDFYDFSAEEVAIRQAILNNCRQRVVVADISKFGRSAPVRGGSLNSVDILVTDLPPPASVQAAAREAGVQLVYNQIKASPRNSTQN